MSYSPPSCKPARFSVLFQKRLNAYALAATAAGVAIAAIPASEGEIIYTPAHKQINLGQNLRLDLDHDGITDFKIRDFEAGQSYFHVFRLSVRREVQGNGVWGHISTFNQQFASALPSGVAVTKRAPFYSVHNNMAVVTSNTGAAPGWDSGTCAGPWANVKDRYLGLKFLINGETHFGWARLTVSCPYFSFRITATLTGYAYETTPGQRIVTGKTAPSGLAAHGRRAGLGQLALGFRSPSE